MLMGCLNSFPSKNAAVCAARRVEGVRAIVDGLTVTLPLPVQRSDTELAHAIVEALRRDVQVPAEHIRVCVENGWVRLDGAVDGQYQATAAERAVRDLMGVRGVRNCLEITQRPSTPDLKQ